MNARPNLRLVNHDGELVGEQCSHCSSLLRTLDRQEDIIARKQREIDELRHAKAQELSTTELAGDILAVLKLHKRLLRGDRGSIVRGGPAWKKTLERLEDTDAETGYLAFSKQHLQGAVVGLWLVDQEDGWYRRHGKIGAAFLFATPDRVAEFLDPVRSLNRTDVPALAIVDELGSPALAWLGERCSCGQLRVAHLMGATVCDFNADDERWMAEA